jgi:hypothetical protein
MHQLGIEVQGNSIIVSLRGTDLSVIYDKRPGNLHAVLPRDWLDPKTTPSPVTEFRADAFRAALAKARELGWIT